MSHKPRNAQEYLNETLENDPVSEALDRLDTRFYEVSQGIIRPLTDHKMTTDEWEAIVYLQDEWTFLYEPESDLLEAALAYKDTRESEEVFVWEG